MTHTTQDNAVVQSTWLVITHDALPVYVTGNTQELGEWNPNKALKMRHSGHTKDEDRWCLHLKFPRDQDIEFKFLEKTEDGKILWEAGSNRIFRAECGDTAIEWGTFRSSLDA